jgi:hypothetical protein
MAQMTTAESSKHSEAARQTPTDPAFVTRRFRRAGWGPALFVGAAWAGMLGAALWFVWDYGTNVPFWPDEWGYASILSGEQPVSLAWLWQQHLEHRLPFPKLVWLGLLRVTGYDFRAGMYCNVLLLGALALVLILAARKLRGRTSYADAFFPLILLHWGHWENLLWPGRFNSSPPRSLRVPCSCSSCTAVVR